jgi:hypothetical protein
MGYGMVLAHVIVWITPYITIQKADCRILLTRLHVRQPVCHVSRVRGEGRVSPLGLHGGEAD